MSDVDASESQTIERRFGQEFLGGRKSEISNGKRRIPLLLLLLMLLLASLMIAFVWCVEVVVVMVVAAAAAAAVAIFTVPR